MKSTSTGLAILMCAAALIGIQFHRASAHNEPTSRALDSLSNARCTKTVCGEYVQSSCHPETDGPVYYFKDVQPLGWLRAEIANRNAEHVATCGGWTGCEGPNGSKACTCPPPEWTSCVESKHTNKQ